MASSTSGAPTGKRWYIMRDRRDHSAGEEEWARQWLLRDDSWGSDRAEAISFPWTARDEAVALAVRLQAEVGPEHDQAEVGQVTALLLDPLAG